MNEKEDENAVNEDRSLSKFKGISRALREDREAKRAAPTDLPKEDSQTQEKDLAEFDAEAHRILANTKKALIAGNADFLLGAAYDGNSPAVLCALVLSIQETINAQSDNKRVEGEMFPKEAGRLIHQEAHAALTTLRPEVMQVLALRLQQQGATMRDVGMLVSALIVTIQQLAEKDRRLNEVDRVLQSFNRTLQGAADQTTALRRIISDGGIYESAKEKG